MGKSEPVVAGNELFGEIVYKNTLKEVVVEASSKLFIYNNCFYLKKTYAV